MTRLARNRLFFVLLLAVTALKATAEPMSLADLMTKTKTKFSWQSGREIGQLEAGAKRARFQLDQNYLMSGSNLVPGTVTRLSNGSLLFDTDAADALMIYFTGRKNTATPAGKRIASGHRVAVILIDPGHGGRDTGALGVTGDGQRIAEKDVTLTVGLALERKLKARFPDKRIIMTRREDVYPTLEDRVKLANNQILKEGEAEIFISIHANAGLNKAARGFEVWRIPDQYDRTLYRDPLKNKNAGSALNALLNDEYLTESSRLAKFIQSALIQKVAGRSPDRGIRQESWFVVRNARMASVLVELGFVTNSAEADLLASPAYLNVLGDSLYTGIADFIGHFER